MLDYTLLDPFLKSIGWMWIFYENNFYATSGHLPVFCNIDLSLQENPHTNESHEKSIAWHKYIRLQLNQYIWCLDESLNNLLDQQHINCDPLYESIVKCIKHAADKTLPCSFYNPFTKPYRHSDVNNANTLVRDKRKLWLTDSKPRGMQFLTYAEYKCAKEKFRRAQQLAADEYLENAFRDLE